MTSMSIKAAPDLVFCSAEIERILDQLAFSRLNLAMLREDQQNVQAQLHDVAREYEEVRRSLIEIATRVTRVALISGER